MISALERNGTPHHRSGTLPSTRNSPACESGSRWNAPRVPNSIDRSRRCAPIDVTRLSSLIAAGVEIAADIRITDGLRIDGQVEGSVVKLPGVQALAAGDHDTGG